MRVLGLDVGDGELRIAHGEQTLAGARVVRVERVPFDGADGLAAALARLDVGRATRIHASVPLQATTHRFVTLPFRDRGRLMRTAPLELLGQLPVEPADVHVATLPLGPCDGGSRLLGVAIQRTVLDAHVSLLPSARWQIGAVAVPGPADGVLLLADGRHSALVHRQGGRLVGLHALGADARDAGAIAAELRWVLHAWGVPSASLVVAGPDATALGELVGESVDAPEYAVARGLVLARERLLLAGDDAAVEPGWWRRAAALAAAAVVLAVVNVVLVHADLRARETALTHAIAATTAVALPGLPPEAARAALEDAAAARRRVRAGDDTPVLEVLREVSARIPAVLALDLDELTVEPEAVVLHGRCAGFDAVDALRRALAASPLVREVTADETRTTVDGTGVEFRLRALRRTAVGAPS